MVARKAIDFRTEREALPLRKTKPKRKYTKKNPYHSVVLKGHKKKEIWSPAFQPVVMVKPLFPEHLIKLIRGEQVMKTVKRRRKQSDSTVPENVVVPYPGKEPENKGVKKIENTEQ